MTIGELYNDKLIRERTAELTNRVADLKLRLSDPSLSEGSVREITKTIRELEAELDQLKYAKS